MHGAGGPGTPSYAHNGDGIGSRMAGTARGGEGTVPAALRGAGVEGDHVVQPKTQPMPAKNSEAPGWGPGNTGKQKPAVNP